jgi:hypothetical protein
VILHFRPVFQKTAPKQEVYIVNSSISVFLANRIARGADARRYKDAMRSWDKKASRGQNVGEYWSGTSVPGQRRKRVSRFGGNYWQESGTAVI